MKNILVLLFTLPISLSAQLLHPTSDNLGCCSERTGIPVYTYSPAESGELLQIYAVNKLREKSIFYFGKYDPWKDPALKNSELFNQRYIVPPGTLPIARGIFLDQTEVANVHYEEFLFFMVKDSGRYKDRTYLPKMDNKIKSNYFKNPELALFPVVSVDASNAEAYCQWRAEKLNEGLMIMLSDEQIKYKFNGRLPNQEEWMKAAESHADFVEIASHPVSKKGKQFLMEEIVNKRFAVENDMNVGSFLAYNVNLKPSSNGIPIEIPQYIYSFKPNKKGFYNMYGNVKETIAGGNNIGGSFLTAYDEDELFKTDDIQAYRNDVGFRCLVEVVKD